MRSQLASTDLGFRSADANYDALSPNLDEQMDDGVTHVRQQQHLGRCEKAYIGNLNRLRKSRKEEGLNRAARVIAENSFKQLFAAYSKEPVYLPLQDVKKVSFRGTHAQFLTRIVILYAPLASRGVIVGVNGVNLFGLTLSRLVTQPFRHKSPRV